MLLLDIVKNPGHLLARDILEYYDYELSDILTLDGKRHFEISFKPKDKLLLYTGKIYIEEKTLAIKGRWYLYYAKNELKIKCNWRKKLFNSTFHSVSEMVITDRYLMGVQPFEKNEIAKSEMVFSEEAAKYYDGSFWENYTIIKPEDDIRDALEKIKVKKEKQ